jgi:hypothetical protein
MLMSVKAGCLKAHAYESLLLGDSEFFLSSSLHSVLSWKNADCCVL